jgi:nicotinate phosphoribosyltransferase
VWRLADASGVLTGRDEDGPPDGHPLLAPMVRSGRSVAPAGGIGAARDRCAAGLAGLPGDARRIIAPQAPTCRPSDHVRAAHSRAVARLSAPVQPPADPPAC